METACGLGGSSAFAAGRYNCSSEVSGAGAGSDFYWPGWVGAKRGSVSVEATKYSAWVEGMKCSVSEEAMRSSVGVRGSR